MFNAEILNKLQFQVMLFFVLSENSLEVSKFPNQKFSFSFDLV